MDIPLSRDRCIRLCDDCVCYYEDDGQPDCNINSDAFYVRIGGYEFDESVGKLVQINQNKSEPCKYYMTVDEYKRMLDG